MALNHAVDSGKVDAPVRGSWKDAEYFKGTRIMKTMFLSQEEQKRLIDCCINEEFKNLVIAGLLTGGRFSELAALTVKDFNKDNGTIYFGPFGKVKGKQRHVFLSEEGITFFSRLCEGKSSNDIILVRNPIKYKSIEKARQNPEKWQSTDHNHCMNLTCKEAGIKGFTFHGLRHQYISVLVNKGVPYAYIANQAGHSSIKLIEQVYGHLRNSDMATSVRSALPKILD
jgi:integrase